MKMLLTTVEDTFTVTNRGVIIAPFFSVKKYRFNTNEKLMIEKPNGEKFLCDAYFQIPFISPPPKELQYHCALLKIEKSDVPIGSKVWILDKSKEQVVIENGED